MPHVSPTRRTASAFTLIELLTVIAIIGILAAILIPTVGKVRAAARNTQCVAQLREWGRVVNMYAVDNKGYYYAKNWASDDESQAPGGVAYKSYFTKSKYDLFRMRYCPSDPETSEILNSTNPKSDPRYAMVQGSLNANPATLASDTRIPLIRANSLSQYMLMVDSVRNSSAVVNMSNVADMISPAAVGTLILPTDIRRHGSKFNAVFGDGSIKRIGYAAASPTDKTALQIMKGVWLQLN